MAKDLLDEAPCVGLIKWKALLKPHLTSACAKNLLANYGDQGQGFNKQGLHMTTTALPRVTDYDGDELVAGFQNRYSRIGRNEYTGLLDL